MWKRMAVAGVLVSVFGVALAQFGTPPSEVTGVQVAPGDKQVTLRWDPATDADGIILGYKVYYGTTTVQTANDVYDSEVLTGSADTTYAVTGLQNGLKYYFTVTALDDEEQESGAYSQEVSSTPQVAQSSPNAGSTLDDESPNVVFVEQTTEESITVTMSEPVRVKSLTNSFIINGPLEEVTVLDTLIKGNLVTLQVLKGSLEVGVKYEVIATSSVEDMLGTPVSSGVTDTAKFVAVDIASLPKPEPVVVAEPTPEPVAVTPEPELPAAPEVDKTAPLDVTGMTVDDRKLGSKGIVILNWTVSLNIDEDVADQVLYVRRGSAGWDDGVSIGKGLGEVELEVEKNTQYRVKIVTVDETGNESDGTMLSFNTTLDKTGPGTGLVIGLMLGTIALLWMMKGIKTA